MLGLDRLSSVRGIKVLDVDRQSTICDQKFTVTRLAILVKHINSTMDVQFAPMGTGFTYMSDLNASYL